MPKSEWPWGPISLQSQRERKGNVKVRTLIFYSLEVGKVGLVLIDREGPSMSAMVEVHAGRETPSLSAMAEVQGVQPGWDAMTLAENVQVS